VRGAGAPRVRVEQNTSVSAPRDAARSNKTAAGIVGGKKRREREEKKEEEEEEEEKVSPWRARIATRHE